MPYRTKINSWRSGINIRDTHLHKSVSIFLANGWVMEPFAKEKSLCECLGWSWLCDQAALGYLTVGIDLKKTTTKQMASMAKP